MAHDTTREAAEVQRAIWRRMGGNKRLATALRMSDSMRKVTMDGIRHAHPEKTEAQIRATLLCRTLGDDLFEAAFLR